MVEEEEKSFFRNDIELDDAAFNIWKEELEKELPSFWESMNR